VEEVTRLVPVSCPATPANHVIVLKQPHAAAQSTGFTPGFLSGAHGVVENNVVFLKKFAEMLFLE
jgi:hypothetical protein